MRLPRPHDLFPADSPAAVGKAAARVVSAAALAFLFAVTLPFAAQAQTRTGPFFPRLGAYPIGNPHDYETEYFRANASKYPVLIVNQWPGWQGGRSMTMAQVMQDIRNRSTVGTKLFIYVNNDAQPDPQTPIDAYYPVWQKLNAEHWWLYSTGTIGLPVRSTFGNGTYGVANNSNFTPLEANPTPPPPQQPQNWIRWKANFDYGFNVTGDPNDATNSVVDGFFMDNVFWRPRVDGDWDRNGTTDSQNDPTVQGWLRDGYKSYFDYVRSIWRPGTPGAGGLQIGNIADWGDPSATIGVLNQVLDGGVMEGLIGESWSVETQLGFDATMAWYRKMIDACRAPKLAIFGHNNWASGNYQDMRYGLASTLMDDAYFYISGTTGYDPSKLLWFDEFNFNLGYPTQPRQVAAWLPQGPVGVWRRDFDNGIVLVNPKGNGPQTVALGGTFHKLTGTQDPVTNNGTTVTSVTLADRDGIILSR
jgi:hypothetical protein